MRRSLAIFCMLPLVLAGSALGQARERRPEMPSGVTSEWDLVYAQAEVKGPGGQAAVKKDLKLDLHRPSNPRGKLPVIVWIHGGAWTEGTKNRLWIPWIAAENYAVASIDYRLSGEMPWPAQIHDCKAAVRWLRANAEKYGLDPARVAAAGDSAGGHLAAMLGVTGGMKEFEGDLGNPRQSSAVQAAIDFFGPADLPELAGEDNVRAALAGQNNRRAACSAVARLNGGGFRDRKSVV